MIGKVYKKKIGEGGSGITNSTIAQYKSSTGTIEPNTFVEISQGIQRDYLTQYAMSLNTTTYEYRALKLDNTRVFVAYSYNSYCYGVVFTFNLTNKTFTKGTAVPIIQNNRAYQNITACLFNGYVLVGTSNSNSYYCYLTKCTISGSTISVGNNYRVSGYAANDYDIYPMGSNKLFVLSALSSSSTTLYGHVATYDSSTDKFTSGSLVSLINNTRYGVIINAYTSGWNVFYGGFPNWDTGVTYYGYTYGTISGTTVTKSSSWNVKTDIRSPKKCVSPGSYAITVAPSSMNSYYYFVSNGTATSGVAIGTLSTSLGYATACSPISNSKYMTFSCINANYLDVRIIDNSYNVEKQATIQVNSIYVTGGLQAIQLSGDTVALFAINSSSGDFMCVLFTYLNGVIKASTTKIDGLTKTQCTSSTAGDVYILSTS